VDPIAELRKMPKGEAIVSSRLEAFSTTRDDAMARMTSALANPAPRAAAADSSR